VVLREKNAVSSKHLAAPFHFCNFITTGASQQHLKGCARPLYAVGSLAFQPRHSMIVQQSVGLTSSSARIQPPEAASLKWK